MLSDDQISAKPNPTFWSMAMTAITSRLGFLNDDTTPHSIPDQVKTETTPVANQTHLTEPDPKVKVPVVPSDELPEWHHRPPISTDVKRYCQGSDNYRKQLLRQQLVDRSASSCTLTGSHKLGGMLGSKDALQQDVLIGALLKQPELLETHFSEYKDIHGLVEWIPRQPSRTFPQVSRVSLLMSRYCSLCDPKSWIFDGSEYDPYITCLYAERDGCIPSSVVMKLPKFIIPWRYRNRKTGEISWKIYHLHKDKITGAENETIVVNPYKDGKLRAVMEYVTKHYKKYPMGPKLVEFLLKVVQETLGNYGLPGGPSSAEADAKLYQRMLSQGHNFLLLCQVDIGVCRHKALLFKILCDLVQLNCAVITGYSTAGRHQWNIIHLPSKGDFLIDPTSRHFTWAKPGSLRTRGYKVAQDDSMGHAGFTQKAIGFI